MAAANFLAKIKAFLFPSPYSVTIRTVPAIVKTALLRHLCVLTIVQKKIENDDNNYTPQPPVIEATVLKHLAIVTPSDSTGYCLFFIHHRIASTIISACQYQNTCVVKLYYPASGKPRYTSCKGDTCLQLFRPSFV